MDFMGMHPDYEMLSRDSDTIDPLPPVLRHGLRGVVVLATISLLSTLLLFTHLTCKLIRYSVRRARRRACAKLRDKWLERNPSLDLNLGLDELHFGAFKKPHLQQLSAPPKGSHAIKDYPPPNQFVVLLYNLLLADMHQAVAFFLNVVWVARDGIFVRTPACWIQGLFISNGDLASSCFIASIALHTYLTVVREYKPPEWILNAWIVSMWIFVYGITIAGIVSTSNGKDAGGYFVRASAWCWINEEFDNLRLITHYMYIFIALIATPLVYLAIFLNLRTRVMRSQMQERLYESDGYPRKTRPPLRHKGSVLSAISTSQGQQSLAARPGVNFDHHPAFLIYPVIYVVCTLPLAMGRVGTLAGADVPLWYFCVAGALIASNGWLDVLLWGTTRHTIVFGPIDNTGALGLETFEFMRTPPDREFGNMVWVQGAGAKRSSTGRAGSGARTVRMWWTLLDKFFGGGEANRSTEEDDENSGSRSQMQRGMGLDKRGSGILGHPDQHNTYRSGHVKYGADPAFQNSQSDVNTQFWDSRDDKAFESLGGIAIKKEAMVTVVRVDRSDLESGSTTPDVRSRTGSSCSMRQDDFPS